MDFPQLTVLFSLLYLATPNSFTVPTFSKTQIAVVFNPPVYFDNETKSLEDFMPPIRKVAITFKKIAVVSAEELHHLSEALSAVATYNLAEPKKDEVLLEASILVEVKKELLNGTDTPRGWNNVVEAAIMANKKYEGSVKRILIDHDDFHPLADQDDMKLDEFEIYVSNAKFQVPSNIELGAVIPFRHCSSDSLPQILRHIHHILFKWYPFVKDGKPRFLGVNPYSSVERLSKEFAECKQIINTYGNLTIGIHTGWFLHPKKLFKPEDDKNLTLFWSLINDFAINFNAEVIVSAAFDMGPHIFCEHCGWWKIVKDNRTNEYTYEEKITISTDKISTSSSAWAYYLLGVIVIIFVGLIFILCVRKYYPNVFYAYYNRYMPNFNCLNM